ncbi:MAG TPA: hypothetical protein VJW73_03435, partial [Gemmatimonadaceae bacterium]|nr:hypothetical protein [Gemmatimonadaceae bacterium]
MSVAREAWRVMRGAWRVMRGTRHAPLVTFIAGGIAVGMLAMAVWITLPLPTASRTIADESVSVLDRNGLLLRSTRTTDGR